MRRGPALLLLAVLLAPAGGCRALEVDLFPLLRSGPVDNQGGWAWEAVGPLIYSETVHPDGKAPRHEWGLRPLFSHRVDPRYDYRQTEVLWPIGRFRRGDQDWYDRVLPIYWNWGSTRPGEEHSIVFVFPCYHRKRSPFGNGWALFPFYGRIEKMFGMDEVSFVLFPLYVGQRRSYGRSHFVLWPFFGWGSGENFCWYRVFPIIGRSERKGYHSRHSYLWPIVSFAHEKQHTSRPLNSYLIWPFWGRWSREDGRASGWSVLFPLFRAGHDEVTGRGDVNAPWPFYQRWWTPRSHGWRLWPLYGTFRSKPDQAGDYHNSDFVLWPIFWSRNYGFRDEQHDEIRAAPVFHLDHWRDAEGKGVTWMVWPLMDGRSHESGESKFAIGSWFPIRIWNDALQDRWGVFLSPYIRWTHADGRAKEQGWLGLYRSYHAPGFSRWTIPILYSHRRSDQGTLDQFLLGTVRYEADVDGASRLRVLGVPIPLTSGSPPPATEAAQPGGRP